MTRSLLHAARGWARPAPVRGGWWDATAVTVSFGVPLGAGLLAGQPLLATAASFGGLAGVYGRTEAHGRRWRTQLAAATGIALAVVVAAASALPGHPLLVVLAVAAAATGATFVADAVRTGPPGAVIPVFAAATVGYQAPPAHALPAVAAAVLTGGALAALVGALPGLRRPDGPRRDAVARALTAVLAALRGPVDRTSASLAVHRAWGVLQTAPRAADPAPARWLARAETALHRHPGGAGAPEALLAELAGAATLLRGRDPLPAPPAGTGDAAGSEVEARSAAVRSRAGRSRWQELRAAARPGSVLHPPAERVGLACLGAGVLGVLLGVGHPAWVLVGAAAVLQSPGAGTTTRRAVQRAAGTAGGLGLAALLVPLAGPHLVVWAVAVACTFALEWAMPRNYALGTVFVTAVALVLTRLGGPVAAPPAQLLADRLLDTLLGVAAGVLVALAVPNRSADRHLVTRLAAVHRAVRSSDVHALRADLVALRAAADLVADDAPARRPPGRHTPAAGRAVQVEEAERAGYLRLSELAVRPAPPLPPAHPTLP